MSNSNNIYTILGKLEGLTPKQEEQKPAQPVYESVEAKGSILEGVAKIEKKLAEQFASIKEGEVEKTKHGIKHKGSYGTEYQGDADDEEEEQKKADAGKRGRGRPRKHAPKEKVAGRGRGRPAKEKEPFSGNAGKSLQDILVGKAPKSKTKGTVIKGRAMSHDDNKKKDDLGEGRVSKIAQRMLSEGVNFRKMAEETGTTLDEMLEGLQSDINEYKMNGSCSERLRDFIELHNHTKRQLSDAVRPEDIPAFQRKQAGKDFPVTIDQVKDRSDNISSPEGLAKLKRDTGIESPKNDLEEELDELAKLAGLQVRESAKPDFLDLDKDGNKSEPMKQASTQKSKDEEVEEGNEFSGELAKAKAAGAKEFEVDGKKYPVKEDIQVEECGMSPMGSMAGDMDADNLNINTNYSAKDGRKSITVNAEGELAEQLAAMLKMAGLAGGKPEHSEPSVKVVQLTPEQQVEEEYANEPNEQVATVDAIVDQGEDLNRQKKQFADKPKAGDNPMAEEFDPIEAMGRKLMREYESIKVSK